MVNIIKPPSPWLTSPSIDRTRTVFLGGSIEMGVAEDWQSRLAEEMRDYDVTLLNPRRDDWDASWRQSIDEPQFRAQVEWELDGLQHARWVIFYFAPGTRSPITLLELGLLAASPSRALVCCPEGFWRKGNIEVVCARFGIERVETFSALVEGLKARVAVIGDEA